MKLEEQRSYAIDGIKGLSCLFIMLGHYLDIYRAADDRGAAESIALDLLSDSFIGDLIAHGTWLNIFFVISGFLLALSCSRSIFHVIERCIKRVLRLAIPVLGACFISWLLLLTIGYHDNAAEMGFMSNAWFGAAMQPEAYTVFFPFKDAYTTLTQGHSELIAPFWCLKDMLLASFMIFFCGYIREISGKAAPQRWKKPMDILLVLVFLFVSRRMSPVIFACFMGVAAEALWEILPEPQERRKSAVGIVAFLLLMSLSFGLHRSIYIWVYEFVVHLPFILNDETVYLPLYISLALLIVLRSERLKQLFSLKPLLWLGKYSFGIYAIHWPVFTSVGCFIMILKQNAKGYVFACLVCIATSLVLAVLFHHTVERFMGYVIKKYDDIAVRAMQHLRS